MKWFWIPSKRFYKCHIWHAQTTKVPTRKLKMIRPRRWSIATLTEKEPAFIFSDKIFQTVEKLLAIAVFAFLPFRHFDPREKNNAFIIQWLSPGNLLLVEAFGGSFQADNFEKKHFRMRRNIFENFSLHLFRPVWINMQTT